MRKLKLTMEDGNIHTAKIVDTETGESIDNVKRIELVIDADRKECSCVVHLLGLPSLGVESCEHESFEIPFQRTKGQ